MAVLFSTFPGRGNNHILSIFFCTFQNVPKFSKTSNNFPKLANILQNSRTVICCREEISAWSDVSSYFTSLPNSSDTSTAALLRTPTQYWRWLAIPSDFEHNILEFDNYGILTKKEFYNKKKMKKISFAKNITENEIRKENFIQGFLSSVRQKMKQRRQ